MTTTLVLPGAIADEITAACREPLERAAVLLARRMKANDDVRLLGRGLHWVPSCAHTERSRHHMLIRSEGYVGRLRRRKLMERFRYGSTLIRVKPACLCRAGTIVR